ncbi:hypothetical protein QBC33DRAFT_542841 [Phialemonium atrogriseum]|uniref:Uncharacterized protein n=1 Tax=Phialemonium atrogriseum TaxID=1093897 RepID=A0AAJ0BX49_9PEZI|nr:uncharacterized protein QBC33DRAFT_542841 [Phialemonium atrogriseum]KAK1765901.1 hypothetical protein QBC33DRAFT_542841 [Phialemonium atrogriseum]
MMRSGSPPMCGRVRGIRAGRRGSGLWMGGVFGPDLTVHGVRGLSVAGCSVVVLVPATYKSSTAYAIAE